MSYVEYNVWTGKIHKVSSVSSLPTMSTVNVIEINSPIIEEINSDKRSLESAFIGEKHKAYNKDGTIHLPKPEKELTEISKLKEDKNSDVSLTLYTNNKLLEVTINYKALKTWYNHRMKRNFKFASLYTFPLTIMDKNNKLIKEIKIPISRFLETFQTTIDLSFIDNLKDKKFLTNRIFQTYYLDIQKNKYYDIGFRDSCFNKVSFDIKNRKKYDIIITKTNEKNTIAIKIIKLDASTIYKSLDFYITENDPNELHEVLSIPIENLWNKKFITSKIKSDLNNKLIWCNNKMLNVLFDSRVINI